MEQHGAAPKVEKLKLVPPEHDLNAYTALLEMEILQSRKRIAELQKSARQATKLLRRDERIHLASYPTEAAASFAKGKAQPLTHDAIEEEQERIKRMDGYADELQALVADIAAERIPGHEAIAAIKAAADLDQTSLYEAKELLTVLERRHNAGEQMSPTDYRTMRTLAEEIAERRGRLNRMKELVAVFREVIQAQEEEFGGGKRGSERAKVERSSTRLMADWKNQLPSPDSDEDVIFPDGQPLTTDEEAAA
jgi:hypothetical protein